MGLLTTHRLFKESLSKGQGLRQLTAEETKKLQETVLAITKDVTALCDRHGIPYSLGGGSALGAVRHHGFIPWDDDIDLNVERKYLMPFCDYVEEELGDRYTVCRPVQTKNYYSTFVQIHRKGTICREDRHSPDGICGIKIDIFPYDNTFRSGFLRFLHGLACDGISFALSCMRMAMFRKEYLALAAENDEAGRVIRLKAALGFPFALFPGLILKTAQRIYQLCRDEDSYYVSCPVGRGHFFGEVRPRKGLCTRMKVSFEDTALYVPKDVHAYLRRLYGDDYMTPPPEEKREKHIVYEIQFVSAGSR